MTSMVIVLRRGSRVWGRGMRVNNSHSTEIEFPRRGVKDRTITLSFLSCSRRRHRLWRSAWGNGSLGRVSTISFSSWRSRYHFCRFAPLMKTNFHRLRGIRCPSTLSIGLNDLSNPSRMNDYELHSTWKYTTCSTLIYT